MMRAPLNLSRWIEDHRELLRPPVGNAQAWAPRLAQGDDALLKHTIEGMPSAGMPPKGMCVACSDRELMDAIHFMTSRSR